MLITICALTILDLVCYTLSPFSFRTSKWYGYIPMTGFIIYYQYKRGKHA